jgi:hypothetical protein
MNTTGHTELLRPHLATIERLANSYKRPGGNGVAWNQALKAEPDLCNVLLLGEGTRKDQIKRLSMFWMRVKPRDASNGVPHRNFRGEQSICSRLDDNREALEIMAKANTNSMGRVSWVAALASSPNLADAIGFTALNGEGQRKMVNVLGFWYRTRRKPGDPAKPKGPKPTGRRYDSVQAMMQGDGVPEAIQKRAVALSDDRRESAPAARFCPRCGEDLGAHALAAGIVASMSASGLTPTQIMQTLTHAANTVTKLSQ